jgi:Zn-dependent M28 family amino/carboxypeptidase
VLTFRILNFSWESSIEKVQTFNLICDFFQAEKSKRKMIILGAHLDSVPNSAGINDSKKFSLTLDASGVSALLEIAIQFFNLGYYSEGDFDVRIAFWSAEEVVIFSFSSQIFKGFLWFELSRSKPQ